MIDCNCFAGPWPFRALPAAAPTEVAALLLDAGFSQVLVSPLEALFFEDPQVANERLAALLPAGDPLLLCAVVNPTLANWERSRAAAHRELGAKAVKLHPNYHAYAAGDAPTRALLEAAARAGLPVVIQLRMQDTRSQHPLCKIPDASAEAALEAAAAVPAARVVLGGIRFGEVTALAARIRALPNVWVDLSQVEHADGLRQTVEAVGADRLLLGTHAPLFNVRSALLKLDEGLLNDNERAAITRGNAERLLR